MQDKIYSVYILANGNNSVLYIGVTGDLVRRVYEHKHNITPGFTTKYQIYKLVYYECFGDIEIAIAREKQLKKWRREKKNTLIEKENVDYDDLYESLF